MRLRRLNNTGISHFASWLDSLRTGSSDPTPLHLLEHGTFSEEVEWDIEIDKNRVFASRYELGEYLVDKLACCDQRVIHNDAGLWSWLALFWLDRLSPVAPDGSRKLFRSDNYILSDRYRNYHRHAIRTTWLFVREHGPTVYFMFSNPLSKRGEVTEQLTARPYFLSCKGLIAAANYLYNDPKRGKWKLGAAGNRMGSARRFSIVLKQLELTYDLLSMDGDEIIAILPASEFERFMTPLAAPTVP